MHRRESIGRILIELLMVGLALSGSVTTNVAATDPVNPDGGQEQEPALVSGPAMFSESGGHRVAGIHVQGLSSRYAQPSDQPRVTLANAALAQAAPEPVSRPLPGSTPAGSLGWPRAMGPSVTQHHPGVPGRPLLDVPGSLTTQSAGTWRTYTNANSVNDLVVEGDTLWAATNGGVVVWDRSDGSYVKYTTAEGLAHNTVNTIAIDHAGHKWFGSGSWGGVSRFDGTNWTSYTTDDGLADNWVNAIAIDHAGQMWFGTKYGGVSQFDGTNWTTYTTADGLADNWVNAIAIDHAGHMWFGTGRGVSRFDGTNWTTWTAVTTAGRLPNYSVNAIAIDHAGHMWFGTWGGGLSHFDGTTWATYTTDDGLADNRIGAIAIDHAGHMWFGTGIGVSAFDGTTWTTADGLARGWVNAIAIDHAGHKWFGTQGGVSVFDGTNLTRYTTADGPVNNLIRTIAIDDAGHKWFGTEGGVSVFDGTNWTTYTTVNAGLADNWVLAVAIDDTGHKWFGTGSGVSRFDSTTWITYATAHGLADNVVLAIAIDDIGHMWFGTRGGGVSRFDGTNWTTYTTDDGLAHNTVRATAIDHAGHIWFGTEGGVSHFDGISWTTYTTDDGLADNSVPAIAIDHEGHKWFGTGGGASRFDGTTWTTYTAADGLAHNTVNAIAIDQEGHRWFGTWSGASRFDGTTWTTYTAADGLAADQVGAIAIDHAGHKWFGTYGGVSVLGTQDTQTYTISEETVTPEPVEEAHIGTSEPVIELEEIGAPESRDEADDRFPESFPPHSVWPVAFVLGILGLLGLGITVPLIIGHHRRSLAPLAWLSCGGIVLCVIAAMTVAFTGLGRNWWKPAPTETSASSVTPAPESALPTIASFTATPGDAVDTVKDEQASPEEVLAEFGPTATPSTITEPQTAGWTWENPLPQGNTLNAIWGSGSDDVFAVGDHGTILHYDGSQWRLMDSGTTQKLNGVWGSDGSSVFAVGTKGIALHYSGTGWRSMPSGTTHDLNSVWGSSANNVFAVGAAGSIQHYDGSSWRTMSSGTTDELYEVWGSEADDIFVVGDNGTIQHYDGTVWTSMSSGTTGALGSIWGSGGDEVYATGGFDILRYDGRTWSMVDCGAGGYFKCIGAYSVWGSGLNDVYFVGDNGRGVYGAILRYDGNAFSRVNTGTFAELYGVWGTSDSDVFAVGQYGTILHYDGSMWYHMDITITQFASDWLHAVWGSEPNNVFAVGGAGLYHTSFTVLHFDGAEWTGTTTDASHTLTGVWGSDEEVFAVGMDGYYAYYEAVVLHSAGGEWRAMDIPSLPFVSLNGVWGSSTHDVFSVGDGGTILHYDGTAWRTMDSGTTDDLRGIWGSGTNDVFTVGGHGTILHYDGTGWGKMNSGTDNGLSGVWGTGPNDVFAVGGAILHYDGTSWQQMGDHWASGVWGSGLNDVFAVGWPGTILHYDGTGWGKMNSGTDNGLGGIRGTGPDDVFAVGEGSTILRYTRDTPPIGSGATDAEEGVHWIVRVSVASDGTQANGRSGEPSISRDGRYVAFSSLADNLVPDDTNGRSDVFVHDLHTRQTTRISVSSAGVQGDAGSYHPHISADGRYVTFVSTASNLVPSDTNGVADIFVHDRETGETSRVSVSSTGEEGNARSYAPFISGDGRYVTFVSTANNLVPNDTNSCEGYPDGHCPDIFVHDRETGETELVSVATDGSQIDGEAGYRSRPAISDDGRFVAFNQWDAESLYDIPWDRIRIRDRESKVTTVVSVDDGGTGFYSGSPSISADGRYIAFLSNTYASISGERNICQVGNIGCPQVYVYDQETAEIVRASVNSHGQQAADSFSYGPQVSADGNYVVFSSAASNLVPNKTNKHCDPTGSLRANDSCYDIFVHTLLTSETDRVSIRPDGGEANNHSHPMDLGDERNAPSVSGRGEYVAFVSSADNLVDNDTNEERDVFVVALMPSALPPIADVATPEPLEAATPEAVAVTPEPAEVTTPEAMALTPEARIVIPEESDLAEQETGLVGGAIAALLQGRVWLIGIGLALLGLCVVGAITLVLLTR